MQLLAVDHGLIILTFTCTVDYEKWCACHRQLCITPKKETPTIQIVTIFTD